MVLRDLGFSLCKSDPDVWQNGEELRLKKAVFSIINTFFIYVDKYTIVSEHPQKIFDRFEKEYNYQCGWTVAILRGKIGTVAIEGKNTWCIFAQDYSEKVLLATVEASKSR